jgi:hypothetical protein
VASPKDRASRGQSAPGSSYVELLPLVADVKGWIGLLLCIIFFVLFLGEDLDAVLGLYETTPYGRRGVLTSTNWRSLRYRFRLKVAKKFERGRVSTRASNSRRLWAQQTAKRERRLPIFHGRNLSYVNILSARTPKVK